MKKLLLSAAVFAVYASASAQTAAPAPAAPAPAAPAAAPASPFTGNLAVVTDYRFRGISQTFKQPAVQGGFDYAHSSGFYLGNWNSNVTSTLYNNGAGLEMDFYGGYKFEPVKDLTADIGFLYYYYPGASVGTTGTKYNNGELYIGGTYKWFSAKYSYGTTDYFGLNNTTAASLFFSPLPTRGGSRGSGYLDLNANFEVADKTTISLHAGRQTVKNYSELSYTDYKVGIAKEFPWATVGLAVVSTNASKTYWKLSNTAGDTKELGTATAVLSVSKTF